MNNKLDRLLAQLNNTQLSTKDNPLYQVLKQMIDVVQQLDNTVDGISDTISTPATPVELSPAVNYFSFPENVDVYEPPSTPVIREKTVEIINNRYFNSPEPYDVSPEPFIPLIGSNVSSAFPIPLPATFGGTGFSSYTVGDMLYASTTTTLAKLVAVASRQVIISMGVGVAPVWSPNLALSGTLGVDGLTTLAGLTINSATVTLSQDTNFILSGGINGVSFDTDTLSIDAANNRVGIGTNTPSNKLEIYLGAQVGVINAIQLTNIYTVTTAGTAIYFKGFYNHALIYASGNASSFTGGNLTFQTYLDDSTPNVGMTISRTDNVGIGTVSPSGKLHIIKDTTTLLDELLYAIRITDGTDDVCLLLGVSATSNIAIIQSLDPGTSWSTRNLSLLPNGSNVGIGTITPSARLAINGGLHVGGDSDPGDNNALIDGTLTVTGATTLTGALAANGGITVDSTAFIVSDTTGNVSTSGTLGVTGITTLSDDVKIATLKKLYLDGGSNTYLHESSADRIQIVCGTVNSMEFSTGDIKIPAANEFYLDGGSNTYIVESSGDVVDIVAGTIVAFRVNTTSIVIPATNRLYLDGGSDTYIYENAANNIKLVGGAATLIAVAGTAIQIPAVYADTTAGTADVTVGSLGELRRVTSSRRYKTDFGEFNLLDAERMLSSLHPVTFTGIKEHDNKRRWLGYIAEEVAEIDDLLVNYDDEIKKMNPNNVLYERIVVPAVMVLNSEREKIKILQQKVEALEAKLGV